MNDVVRYGQLNVEKTAEENLVCRQIVKEISLFGITERQRLMIIYLLAMEIENIEQMQSMTSLIKDVVGDDLFLSGKVQ